MEIRHLQNREIREIAEFMSMSFIDDPLYKFFVSDTDMRIKFMRDFFAFRLKYAQKCGKVFVTTDKKAVAAWIPPNVHMKPAHLVMYGGIKPLFALDKQSRANVMSYSNFSSDLENNLIKVPHWHLSPIAVDPDYWNKGYAHCLVRQMLDHFDENEQYCFLETQTDKNRKVYEKYGFKTVTETVMPGSNVNHYPMLREPGEAKTGK